MDDATALALNAINLALYRDRAAEWSAVRTRPWRGFARVAGELASLPGERLRVLDVGCGNGRFLRTLDEALGALRQQLGFASRRLGGDHHAAELLAPERGRDVADADHSASRVCASLCGSRTQTWRSSARRAAPPWGGDDGGPW